LFVVKKEKYNIELENKGMHDVFIFVWTWVLEWSIGNRSCVSI